MGVAALSRPAPGMKSSMETMRFLTRAVATSVAALIVIASADFAEPGWFEEWVRWLQPALRSPPPPKLAARSGPIGPPVSITPMRPEGNDSSVSAVALALKLVRTQRGRNSREGFAQIGVRARSPQTYSAGALLANGARLTEIYDHYVVLEHEGHTARLYLQGEVQPDARSAQDLLTVGGTPETAAVIANSHDALTVYLRPSPVFVGNQLQGFVLNPGHDPAPFSQLGLQPGDVLTHINGTAISDPSDSLYALHTLIKGETLTVEVERKGSPHTLSLDGSILTRADAAMPAVIPTVNSTPPETPSSVALPSLFTRDNPP
jgi:type II secretion system protein C